MRYDVWFHIQNILQSLVTSTNLDVYTNKFSLKLNHRNSPYISHSQIYFEPGNKEMDNNIMLLSNGRFSIVLGGILDTPRLNDVAYKLISKQWTVPFEWDLYVEKIPSHMVSNLVESIPIETINVMDSDFVQIACPIIKSFDIGYISKESNSCGRRYRAKILKYSIIEQIRELYDKAEKYKIDNVDLNRQHNSNLELIYIADGANIFVGQQNCGGLQWSSGEACIDGVNFSMSPADYTSLYAYMGLNGWFLICNPDILVNGEQIFPYDTGVVLVHT